MSSAYWTYKVHVIKPKSAFSRIEPEALEIELNRLGGQGWNLVHVRSGEGSSKLQLIMKRPR
ncbi:MAG: DUF4177 domain-containing protein [Pseudomonadota bacterium]